MFVVSINRLWSGIVRNNTCDEIRWQVIKAMLDEFPTLKERVKNYLKEEQKSKQSLKKEEFSGGFRCSVVVTKYAVRAL